MVGDGARAEVLRPGEGRRCYECQRGKKATKKRDTFVVPRWRGEGRVSFTRPALAQARVRAIERRAGETIRAVRAMTTAKTTDATEAT